MTKVANPENVNSMEYWNSTRDQTGTGRPVDALIMPVAPFAAARREQCKYYGYTTIVNVLDYTACTVPVTCSNQNIDIASPDFKPVSELDQDIMATCGFALRIRVLELMLPGR